MSETTDLIRELTRENDQTRQTLAVALRVIAATIPKQKTITAAQFDKATDKEVQIQGHDDGSITVVVT